MKRYLIKLLPLLVILFAACEKEENKKWNSYVPSDLKSIVKENVVGISSEQENYIVRTNGDSLFFQASTSANYLPEIGKIVVCNTISAKHPDGVYGKVEKITEKDGLKVLILKAVPLEDAFNELYINENISLSDNVVRVVSLQDGSDIPFDIKESRNNELTRAWGDTKYVSLDIKLSTDNVDIKGLIALDLNCNPHISLFSESNIDFSIKSILSLNAIVKLAVAEHSDLINIPIGKIEFKSLPATVVLTPSIELYLSVDFEGEVTLSAQMSYSTNTFLKLRYNSGVWNGEMKGEKGQLLFKPAELNINGSLTERINLAFKLALFGRNELSLKVTPSLGLSEKADLLFSFEDLNSGNFYDEAKDSKFTLSNFAAIDVNVNLFETNFQKEFTYEKNILEWYLLPEFSEFSYERGAKDNVAVIHYRVDNDLILPATVGLALFDENSHLLEKWYSDVVYKSDEQFNNPLSGIFSGLVVGAKYKVRPLVSISDVEIVAGPESEFRISRDYSQILDIYNLDDLLTFHHTVMNKVDYTNAVVNLRSNIDMSSVNSWRWDAHGDYLYSATFAGIFNGNNHSISNLRAADCKHFLSGAKEVKNLIISSGEYNQPASGICDKAKLISNCKNYANLNKGGLGIGTADLIENCENSGNIKGGSGCGIGNATVIRNCINRGDIVSPNYSVGGISLNFGGGGASTDNIVECVNGGRVQGRYAGGIAASLAWGAIKNCTNNGQVVCDGTGYVNAAGGIVGILDDRGSISECTSAGKLIKKEEGSRNLIGWIVGYCIGGYAATNCVNATGQDIYHTGGYYNQIQGRNGKLADVY